MGLEEPGRRVKDVARVKMLKRLYSRENSASVSFSRHRRNAWEYTGVLGLLKAPNIAGRKQECEKRR